MEAQDQIFWTFFITTMCGFILTLVRQAYKSKCKEVSCGCLRIIRDTEHEIELDEIQTSTQSEIKSPDREEEKHVV